MSCPLPDMVRFKGSGRGGGRGSGLGLVGEDTIGLEAASWSAPSGDEGPLSKAAVQQLKLSSF